MAEVSEKCGSLFMVDQSLTLSQPLFPALGGMGEELIVES